MSRQFRSDDTNAWVHGFGNGSDGALTISGATTFSAANIGCSGTSGTTALTLSSASTFANGDLVLIHQTRGTGVGTWELNKIASGAGTTSLTMEYTLQQTYTDSGASQAQILTLKQYSVVTVNSGQTWSASEWDGDKGGILAFFCNGTVTVTGTISATGKGFLGGALVTGDTVGKQGDGTSGAGTNSQSANGDGGGGGQRHNPGVYNPSGGGGGGHASAGSNPTNKTNSGSGTVGGSSAGNASLTSLVMGGGGGAGGGKSGGGNSGAGGDGGGIICIFAKDISIGGSVTSGGNNGTAPSNTSDAGGDGGGGGAGGAVLLKGETIAIGTSKITVAAGSGNTSGSHSNAGNGSVGRIHADYSVSFSGTSSPTIDTTNDTTILGVVYKPMIMAIL